MKCMRIGIFTDTYPPYINGVSTSIKMLQNALEKKGHQVFVVTVNSEKFKYENENKIIRIPGIPIGIYDYRLTGVYPLRAIEKIRKWNLDVIHSHTEFGVGTFARIISKQFDIPLIHTYHTMYEDYVHYITKGYFDGASKKIVQYLTKFYCDTTTSELIVPTDKTYRLFKEKYKFDRNVHIVPTGIEVERFYKERFKPEEINKLREKIGLKKDDFVLLFVGRLAAEKNVDFLIDEQSGLVKKYKNCKLLIVGDGPDIDKYKKKTDKLKLNNNIIFTGKVPWEEVPKYYQLANVFVTASKSETQGLTVIEAMAASKVVIAVDDESFRPVINEDLNGYLFKTKKEYRKHVEDFINDDKKLKYMSKEARLASEKFSSKYFAESVLRVYECALKGRKRIKKNFFERFKDVFKKGIKGK